MDVLRTMRAMRRLKPDPVPRELLERLVGAATWAPSGGNQHLYSYVVVSERAQVARLGALWRDVQSKYQTVAERVGAEVSAGPASAAVFDGPISGRTLRRDTGGDCGLLLAAARPP